MERALASERLERAIEDRQVFGFQTRRNFGSIGVDGVLDGVERIDMRDDAFDLLGVVTEFLQRRLDGLIDNFEHAAARKQLVFYQRDVRFNPGRVAVYQETDRARRGEHGDLRVAITVTLSEFRRA